MNNKWMQIVLGIVALYALTFLSRWEFAYVNIGLRAVLTLCAIYTLVRWGLSMNLGQRAGVGIVGGSSIMTIPLILDVYKNGTPFDGWATSLLTIGCITFFSSTVYRFRKHDRNNRAAIEAARSHFGRH